MVLGLYYYDLKLPMIVEIDVSNFCDRDRLISNRRKGSASSVLL
jgi:hypothetical protein